MGSIASSFAATASPVGPFLPHGYCIAWEPGLMALHVVSDAAIALAYYSIPLTLLYFLSRRALPGYNWVLALFAAFILAGGTTHLLGIVTLWEPVYWLQGWLKAATAVVSVATAALIWPLVARALALPAPGELHATNAQLRAEIAERTRAERELRGLHRQLEEKVQARTADLERARNELQREVAERKRIDRHKDELVAMVSHELRTPLTSMSGSLHMLTADDSLSKGEQRELGDIALRSTERLIRLVDSLLDLDRIGSRRTEFAAIPVSLTNLAQMAIQDNEGYARQFDVRLAPVDATGAGMVRGDADRLIQVLTNLISNAVKHAPRASDVALTVRENGEQVRVSVTDHGPGIPPEMRSRVFDKYVQVARASSVKAKGHGLGLSIARAIVERHGGRIGVESTEDGTTFYFALPAFKAQPDSLPTADAPPDSAQVAPART